MVSGARGPPPAATLPFVWQSAVSSVHPVSALTLYGNCVYIVHELRRTLRLWLPAVQSVLPSILTR